MVLDMFNEESDEYTCSTDEERAIMKPMMAWPLREAGDAIRYSPGFSFDYFENGDTLIEHYCSDSYEQHHGTIVDYMSLDLHLLGAELNVLALEFGRAEEVMQMLEGHLTVVQKFAVNPLSNGYVHTASCVVLMLPQLQHVLGLSTQVQQTFATFGLTFENLEERYDTLTKPMQGSLYTATGHKGPGGGTLSTTRCMWQLKAMCILNLDVPKSQSVAWLKSLPNNEAVIAYAMTLPHMSPSGGLAYHPGCWLALTHEQVGLYDGAVRFADLQLETDVLKAGVPLTKWPQVIALACKARVFAKLNRHEEALVAFQAAIATSKQSYSLMEAFALRELANYVHAGDAAVHAGKALEQKLRSFKSRMTVAEFGKLTIAPGRNQIIAGSPLT